MTKRTARAQRTQAENSAGLALAHLVEPMVAGMTSTRQHLLAWVHAHGLAALDEVFRDEAGALAGPTGRHQPQRTHHHWGTAATELTFGGRRVQVRRPRVRQTAGGEATLPSVAAFRDRDPLTARMMQQLLAGVSTRDYDGSLEARPSGRPTRGSSKSAVSRAVVRRTRQRLQEHLARRLDGLEVVALFMDGVVVAQQTVIVVLGITREGGKVPLGLRLGSTENAVICTELLQDLLTVLKLGLPATLRRFFATTNCIENLIGTVRHVTRHIKRWRDGDMRRRWIGLGLLRAAERFRRIKRHGELGVLVTALGAAKAAERAA